MNENDCATPKDAIKKMYNYKRPIECPITNENVVEQDELPIVVTTGNRNRNSNTRANSTVTVTAYTRSNQAWILANGDPQRRGDPVIYSNDRIREFFVAEKKRGQCPYCTEQLCPFLENFDAED